MLFVCRLRKAASLSNLWTNFLEPVDQLALMSA